MKNAIKITRKGLVVVAMFVSMLSLAKESFVSIIKKDTKKAALILNDVKKGDQLSILDESGVLLYEERIRKSGTYAKGFDLAVLPEGTYAFRLSTDTEIKTMPFTIDVKTIVFNKALETVSYKPVIRVKDNLAYITKLNLNLEPVSISVYFESFDKPNSEKLIYSETVYNTKEIGKVLNLKSKEKGKYRIALTTEGSTYTETIN